MILYTGSAYFKRRLDAYPRESRRLIPYSKAQVASLVDFMHSLTFDMPRIDRIEDFGWLLKLVGFLQLQRREKVILKARDWLGYHLDEVSGASCAAVRERLASSS